MKFDQKDRLISSVAFREKLAYIFQNFSKNCLDKIPINSLVSAMDEVAINEFKS
jgi:hypothetical protein